MNMEYRKAGRLLLALNFVLTAGVVVAGADFLASDPSPSVDRKVFRDIGPRGAGEAPAESAFADYASITGSKFRTRGEGGRSRPARTASPGAASALEKTLRLLGTMLSNNEAYNAAVVEEVGTKRQHTVRVGDMVGSVEVTAIRSEEIEVLFHGESAVLRMDFSAPGGGSRTRASSRPRRRPSRPAPSREAPKASRASRGGKDAPGKTDEVAPYLAKLSPELVTWWKGLSRQERERWEKWWLNRSPAERKKWEKKFMDIARRKKKAREGR